MQSLMAGLVLAGILGGLLPQTGSDPLAGTFPREAVGDLRFEADAARFLEEGKPVVEVALSLPEEGLGGGGDTAKIDAMVQLLDAKGNGRAEYRTLLAVPPGESPQGPKDRFPAPRRWLRLTAPWLEGTVGLRVRVEDRERLKNGLLDRMRGRRLVGEASGRLDGSSSALRPGSWMSDLLFSWGPTNGAGAPPGTGLRGVRARLEPNPHRFYGLYQPILTVYWERYPPPAGTSVQPGQTLLSRSRILRLADSAEVESRVDTLRAESAPQWVLKRFDLSLMEAGSYRYEVALVDPDSLQGPPLGTAGGNFQVVWERSGWTLNENQLLAYGRVLLPSERYAEFEALDRGGMENYLRELWDRLSPVPAGGENPIERKFLERVRYASQAFSGKPAGILSDQGRVYVRFGPPDEIRTELNPQDQRLLWITIPQEVDRSGADHLEDLERESRHRTRQDNRAYEIWEYTIWGDPLLPEYITPGQKHGMKFIFVDEMGVGDLTLAYTNTPTSLQ